MAVDPVMARRMVAVCLSNPDDLALAITYLDLSGKLTKRTISPIRYLTRSRLLVYCLSRGEPRSIYLERVVRVQIRHTADVLAPEQIGEFQRGRHQAGEVEGIDD